MQLVGVTLIEAGFEVVGPALYGGTAVCQAEQAGKAVSIGIQYWQNNDKRMTRGVSLSCPKLQV